MFLENGYSERGPVALVNVELRQLVYKIELMLPEWCQVMNDGTMFCVDALPFNGETRSDFYVFEKDAVGKSSFYLHTTANIAEYVYFENDLKFAAFTTFSSKSTDGDKLFIIDLNTMKLRYRLDCSYHHGVESIWSFLNNFKHRI